MATAGDGEIKDQWMGGREKSKNELTDQ